MLVTKLLVTLGLGMLVTFLNVFSHSSMVLTFLNVSHIPHSCETDNFVTKMWFTHTGTGTMGSDHPEVLVV